MPKRTYSVTEFYPVFDASVSDREPKRVSFTTSKRYPCNSWLEATAMYWGLRLLNSICAPAKFSRYYTVQFAKHAFYGYANSDFGPSWKDEGAWRSYSLDTAGDTLQELFDNAIIEEVGQDGSSMDCYGLDEGSHVSENARELITAYFKKASAE